MIVLHQFRRMFGIPNLSPFCMKVEAWLRMARLDYEVSFEDDPRSGPLGKLPVIVDADGTAVPDSTLIIDYLEERYGVNFDHWLSPEQMAISHAFQRLLEERLYWACVYNRWVDDNWPKVKAGAFGKLPPIVKDAVPALIQKKIKRDLRGQGLGLHDRDTIYEFACRDLEALSDYLGDKSYFMGDKLSNIDSTLLAFLCGLVKADLPGPMKDKVMSQDNLMAYQERLGKRFFPDFYS